VASFTSKTVESKLLIILIEFCCNAAMSDEPGHNKRGANPGPD